MAKNQLAQTANKKFRSVEEIMRDPTAKATLSNLVDEAVSARVSIEAQKQLIKDLRENALQELGLKPALFNNYVTMLFNNDYHARKEVLEQQLTLVELVMSDAGIQSIGTDE